MKKVFFFILFLMSFGLQAQDVHFSQFNVPTSNLNPALAVDYDGAYRGAFMYRNQWAQINKPLNTILMSFDKKIYFFSDEIDAGIVYVNDQFQGFNQSTNKVLLNGAYKKNINGHILMGGIQTGVVFKQTNLALQTFDNQWVYQQGVFDDGLSSGEDMMTDSEVYWDLNIGFAWSKKISEKFTPKVGMSFFHINLPKDSYFNEHAERLSVRYSFHGGFIYKLNHSLSFDFNSLIMGTTNVQDVLTMAKLVYNTGFSSVPSLNAGLSYRNGFDISDAIIPVVGFTVKTFDFGFSYDFNVSSLSDYTTMKTTFEMSIVYRAPSFNPKKLSIPCDRY
jgi:type IX secretion system PorP/SprF family membrane protein